MSKKFIDYNKLTKAQAVSLAKERKIPVMNESDIEKTKTVLIAELKASH